MLNDFYNKLLNTPGSRKVTSKGSTVSAESNKSGMTAIIKSKYEFKGVTNVNKETMNLLNRTASVVKLTKLEIIRTTNIKDVSIAIRFLSEDDVLLFTESDKELLTMSDTFLLRRLGIEIV